MSRPNNQDPRPQRHYEPLDGLRGLAIALVISVHTISYDGEYRLGRVLSAFAEAGWIGVTLFFVLSGFLISGILIDTRNRTHYYRDFYARRSLRIFPLYFGFLGLYTFVSPHLPILAEHWRQPSSSAQYLHWLYLTNMQEWILQGKTTSGPLDMLWSLAVEEQTYLLWPLLVALIPSRHLGVSFVGLIVCSFVWRLGTRLAGQPIALAYCWAPGNLEAFAAGGLVAHLSRVAPSRVARLTLPTLIASLAFVGGMFIGMRHFTFWRAPAEVLTVGTSGVVWGFASLIALCITLPKSATINQVLSNRGLTTIGKYSYAIYLFHMPLIALLRPAICESGSCQQSLSRTFFLFASVSVCSFAAALASWYLWEVHFLKLKRFFPSAVNSIRASR